MADVQLENGYTRLANEILEHLAKTNMNGSQRRILDVLLRYTFGFQRNNHELSLTFISKATLMHKMQIQRELEELIKRNIVLVESEASFNKPRKLSLNKQLDSWVDSKLIDEQLADKLPVSGLANHTVSGLANHTVSGLANQERKLKERIKTDSVNPRMNDELKIKVEDLWKMYPEKKGKAIAIKKIPKLIKEHGAEQIQRTIERYIKEIRTKDIKSPYIKHGSSFFTSGYVDFLDENYAEQAKGSSIMPGSLELKPADLSKWV